MRKIELHNHGTNGDPVPSFPTSAEIEIAEELRHRLEERWLAPSAPPAPLPALSSDTPDEAPGPGTCSRHEHKK
jgi:hypothetical protein